MADPSAGQTTYVTVAEIAEELRVSSQTVYRLIDRGEIPALRLGHRTYRIPTEDYAAYKAQLHTDAYARAREAGLPPHIPGQTEIPTVVDQVRDARSAVEFARDTVRSVRASLPE